MQKTPKRSLLKDLETRVISKAPSNINTLVIEAMFLLRLIKELVEMYGLLARAILKKVCAVSNVHRIDFTFDNTM